MIVISKIKIKYCFEDQTPYQLPESKRPRLLGPSLHILPIALNSVSQKF